MPARSHGGARTTGPRNCKLYGWHPGMHEPHQVGAEADLAHGKTFLMLSRIRAADQSPSQAPRPEQISPTLTTRRQIEVVCGTCEKGGGKWSVVAQMVSSFVNWQS